MGKNQVARRSFGIGLIGVLSLPLAGCLGDDDNDGDEDDVANGDEEEANGEEENGDDEEASGDDEDGEELEEEEDANPILSVVLENEDGEPVSSGVEVVVEPDDRAIRYRYSEDIEDGRIVEGDVEGIEVEDGDHTITVESLEEEFETVEETVTVDGEDEEVTLTLEGATGDDVDEGDDDDGEDE